MHDHLRTSDRLGDEGAPEAEPGADAQGRRKVLDHALAEAGQAVERPIRGARASMRDDDPVGRRLFALDETEHGAERRQPQTAITHPGRTEPVLVEIEARWRDVGDALMQAGYQQAAYPGVNHVPGSL